jgi:hypothetical protein
MPPIVPGALHGRHGPYGHPVRRYAFLPRTRRCWSGDVVHQRTSFIRGAEVTVKPSFW